MIQAIENKNPIHIAHNPNCKLVSKYYKGLNNYIQLVYSENNEGKLPGLEVYYYPTKETDNGDGVPGDHHYYSRYYREYKIPSLYQAAYQILKGKVKEVKPGHKLSL